MFFIFFEGITTAPFYVMSGIWSWGMFNGVLFGSGVISMLYVLANYNNPLGYVD